jgi:hypothetical protein
VAQRQLRSDAEGCWGLAQADTCVVAMLPVLPSAVGIGSLGSSTSLSAHNLESIMQLHCILGASSSIFQQKRRHSRRNIPHQSRVQDPCT